MSASHQLLASTEPVILHHKRSKHPKRNVRAETFIRVYLETGHGTNAALAAGYTQRSASQAATRLLQKPEIASVINAELTKRAEMAGLTATYVLESVRAIAEDPTAKNQDKLRAHELLGKYLKLWTDKVEVGITDDLADRVARAREQATRALPEGDQ